MKAKGSGAGSAWCWEMYWPDLRVHQKSVSMISGEKRPRSRRAVRARRARRRRDSGISLPIEAPEGDGHDEGEDGVRALRGAAGKEALEPFEREERGCGDDGGGHERGAGAMEEPEERAVVEGFAGDDDDRAIARACESGYEREPGKGLRPGEEVEGREFAQQDGGGEGGESGQGRGAVWGRARRWRGRWPRWRVDRR